MLKVARIVVPTDFSLPSQKALRYAIELAQRFGAQLLLLHVVEPPTYSTVVGVEGTELAITEMQERARAWSREQLGRMQRDEIPDKVAARTLLREGSPAIEIAAAAAEERADLVVMSTHGYTGLKHALLGSTAEKVVRHAPCPVLTVRDNTREFIMP